MGAIISKALRDEVLSAARAKHAKASSDLTEMYREHAKRAARTTGVPCGPDVERRIDAMVERQLRLS
ncbi:hypothetical protein [Rhizobium leguminosarum]|uniref:hypothetical protein n=1 Tax=Rhizobium leguminosarum TaxID=384 RepID=UPI002E14F91B|nr:hypothetical protein U8Q02_41270 [Rhizobium leguminosarum]